MAKDKSNTKGKAKAAPDIKTKPGKTKPGKTKGGNDEFAKPSEAPGGGDGWKFAVDDNVGELFLFTPLRTETVSVTRGKKTEDAEVVVADVVHLNEKRPEKSELHEEVFIFSAWVKGSLRGYIGERKVLGRLDTDADKSQGDRPAWVLLDADDDDIKVAKAYLETVDPFKTKGSKSGKTKGGK